MNPTESDTLNHRLPKTTKLAFGVGAVAFAIKNNGFDYFFLIFYSQVLGVDASLVGTALVCALIFDALSDPLIGYMSDNTHSKWGRRHPYMYAVALPLSISYYFIWNPPESLQGNELFPYLLFLAIFVRTLITAYEVPSAALTAELSDNYDERTSLLSYRYFFGWTGGTLLSAFALAFLLVPTAEIPNGMFNIEGFNRMGMLAAGLMFVTIFISATGTHSHIPMLKSPPKKRKLTLTIVYRELFETLASKSFVALFLAALFASVANGLSAGLNIYFSSYFWGFDNAQLSILSLSVVLSAVIGALFAPVVSKKIGKKKGAIVVGLFAFTLTPLNVLLRLLGLFPENGDPLLFPIILAVSVLSFGLIITFGTLMTSMLADLVEESEVSTRRRSEGIFFSALTFAGKAVQGLGVASATAILTIGGISTWLATGPGAARDHFQSWSLLRSRDCAALSDNACLPVSLWH